VQRENEFQFLCALVSSELSQERIEPRANWNLSVLNWNDFLELAEHHGVLQLAAHNLIEHPRGLPPEIDRSLRFGYEQNLRRSLWFAGELARIARQFELRQMRVVPFKGAALAQSLYGDLGLRSFSDLDFLISPADFEPAEHVLSEAGYRPSTDFVPHFQRFWLRTGYERSFDGAAGKNVVELQWALLPRLYAVDLRVEDLLERAGTIIVSGREMLSLSPEDSLLALCLHAAKHLWTRLIWLSDIAKTLLTQHMDYSLVFSRARSLGIVRILGISLWLTKKLFYTDLPKLAEEVIASDPQVPALGEEFAGRLSRSASYDFESTEYFRLILKLRERPRDRLRYLWRLVWTPGAGDIAAVRLPEVLFPFYRIVRTGRLLRRFVWSRR
jgi:Uncharacterised nucleotidyltransferase